MTAVMQAGPVPAGYQLKIILRNNYGRTSWALAAAGSWAGPADRGLLLYDRSNGPARPGARTPRTRLSPQGFGGCSTPSLRLALKLCTTSGSHAEGVTLRRMEAQP
jgi:hypothetical protein